MLLQLFPDAQFIYIHRHPYDVFRSAAHMADTTYWYTYFNTPRNDQILEFILRQYEILWERYEEGRKILQQATNQEHNRLVEVSFEELSQSPIQTINGIYKKLGWTMPSSFQQKLEDTVQNDVKTYKKNSHNELESAMKLTIQKRWGPSFDRLGYER